MLNHFRSVASFIRWRLKVVRWLGKLLRVLIRLPNQTVSSVSDDTEALSELRVMGYTKVATGLTLPAIDIDGLVGKSSGRAFINVAQEFPDVLVKTFVQVMKLPGMQEMALNYFNGRPWLWNVALNYSDAVDRVSESQLWHFDYGDTKQLHFMIYFTDVDLDCGPFTFLDAPTSAIVTRHPLVIERLTDQDLFRDYDVNVSQQSIQLIGSRGDIYAADPGKILHQGARCMRPRLVMFITFTTPAPMSRGGCSTMSNLQRITLWDAMVSSGTQVLNKHVFI